MEWLQVETTRLPFAAAPTAAAQAAAGVLRSLAVLETGALALLVRRPLGQLLLATALAAAEEDREAVLVWVATVAADIAFWFLIPDYITSLRSCLLTTLRFARQLLRRSLSN